MLYRIVDHYNDYEIKNNNDNKNSECFICYEISCENEEEPIKLNSKNYYLKDCTCDGFIHKKCLSIWYEQNKKCPICRMYMSEKTNMATIIILNRNGYILFFYLVIKKNIKKFLKYLSVCFLMYFIYDYYLTIINTRNNLYYYDFNNYSNKSNN
jgi:hypothetical protein